MSEVIETVITGKDSIVAYLSPIELFTGGFRIATSRDGWDCRTKRLRKWMARFLATADLTDMTDQQAPEICDSPSLHRHCQQP